MKILLIFPRCPDSYREFRLFLQFISPKVPVLESISAMFPTTWKKKLVDMNVATLYLGDIKWADYVFISAMEIQKESANRVISICKKLNKKIVAEGSLFIKEHRNYPQIDHFVLNETKITMPLFLTDLSAGNPQRIYMIGQYASRTKISTHDYHLLSVNDNSPMNIKVSTGCPFACNFREVASLLGHRPKMRKAAQSKDKVNIQFHSVFFISFLDKSMRECWKLIGYPHFSRPESIIETTTFSVYDHHSKLINQMENQIR